MSVRATERSNGAVTKDGGSVDCICTCTLTGISPLLMARFNPEVLTGELKMHTKTPQQQAEFAAYRTAAGLLYVPGGNLQRGMVSAARYLPKKGLKSVIAGSVRVAPDEISLGTDHFEVDSRSGVNRTNKARVMVHRPMLESWTINPKVHFDESLLSRAQIETLLRELGRRIGIGAFRPEKNGWFGRFEVGDLDWM